MPTIKQSQQWCICKHHRSKHFYAPHAIMECSGVDCNCPSFVTNKLLREAKHEDSFREAVKQAKEAKC